MFERFTEDARQVVFGARSLAIARGDSRIGPLHLLSALTTGDSVAARVLAAEGVDPAAVGRLLGPGPARTAEDEPAGPCRAYRQRQVHAVAGAQGGGSAAAQLHRHRAPAPGPAPRRRLGRPAGPRRVRPAAGAEHPRPELPRRQGPGAGSAGDGLAGPLAELAVRAARPAMSASAVFAARPATSWTVPGASP